MVTNPNDSPSRHDMKMNIFAEPLSRLFKIKMWLCINILSLKEIYIMAEVLNTNVNHCGHRNLRNEMFDDIIFQF